MQRTERVGGGREEEGFNWGGEGAGTSKRARHLKLKMICV